MVKIWCRRSVNEQSVVMTSPKPQRSDQWDKVKQQSIYILAYFFKVSSRRWFIISNKRKTSNAPVVPVCTQMLMLNCIFKDLGNYITKETKANLLFSETKWRVPNHIRMSVECYKAECDYM